MCRSACFFFSYCNVAHERNSYAPRIHNKAQVGHVNALLNPRRVAARGTKKPVHVRRSCLNQLRQAARTPQITAAATSLPTVTASKLAGSSQHSYLVTILQSLSNSPFFFPCKEKSSFFSSSSFLFFLFLHPVMAVESQRKYRGGKISVLRFFLLFPPPLLVRSYFASFLELSVISDCRGGGEKLGGGGVRKSTHVGRV